MKIIGIDEVGRGSIAGPLVMCSVILTDEYPKYCNWYEQKSSQIWIRCEDFNFVRDSKKLAKNKRSKIVNLVKANKIPNLILQVNNKIIDRYGIGVCLSHLVWFFLIIASQDKGSTKIIIDGKITLISIPNKNLVQEILFQNSYNLSNKVINFIKDESTELIENKENQKIIRENKADDKYLSVAIASNLAKVYRDNYMQKIDSEFPDFDWKNNKGYATKKHLEQVKKQPKNPYLRYSFLSRIL